MAPSPNDRHAPSSLADDEGVRVLRKPSAPSFAVEARLAAGVALAVGVAVAFSLWTSRSGAPAGATTAAAGAGASPAIATPAMGPARPHAADAMQRVEVASTAGLTSRVPSGDPDDLASYFRPGDPVPSTANLIKAMNEAGIRTGIAAFNPPGTSPPLEGLAVPADFELPPGYVRHHQATDEGETIEPILMFSPDLVLRDAQGRPIPLPANRVVPPELAPPGLPLRWVRPGKS